MGWAIGQQYVKRYFPPSAKASITSLVGEVKEVFAERLRHNPWMSPETREKAGHKLNNFRIEVGYPTKWRDYTALEVKKAIFSAMRRALRPSTGSMICLTWARMLTGLNGNDAPDRQCL